MEIGIHLIYEEFYRKTGQIQFDQFEIFGTRAAETQRKQQENL